MGTGSSIRMGASGTRTSTKAAGAGGTKQILANAAWGRAAPTRDRDVAEPECFSQPHGHGAVRAGPSGGFAAGAVAWTDG
jgi:hypothetical protein